ncbi:hypothetical protein H4R19_002344 [Coemansia spiralis]|nr:hypothetical protein H4R19_002344 [Coemansia spiralis]
MRGGRAACNRRYIRIGEATLDSDDSRANEQMARSRIVRINQVFFLVGGALQMCPGPGRAFWAGKLRTQLAVLSGEHQGSPRPRGLHKAAIRRALDEPGRWRRSGQFHQQSGQIRAAVSEGQDGRTLLRALDSALREALIFLPPYDQQKLAAELDALRRLVHADRAPGARAGAGFRFRSAGATRPGLLPSTPRAEPASAAASTGPPAPLAADASLVFAHITDQWVVAAARDPAQPGDCELRDVRNCVVDLRRASGALRALNCHGIENTIILCGVLAGSVTIRGAVRCLMVLGAHQLRFENSHNVDAYVFCSSHPIIEKSSAMRFAQYPPELHPGPVDPKPNNMYDQVHDFNWLRRQPSPNWSLDAPPAQLQVLWPLVDGPDQPLAAALQLLPPG